MKTQPPEDNCNCKEMSDWIKKYASDHFAESTKAIEYIIGCAHNTTMTLCEKGKAPIVFGAQRRGQVGEKDVTAMFHIFCNPAWKTEVPSDEERKMYVRASIGAILRERLYGDLESANKILKEVGIEPFDVNVASPLFRDERLEARLEADRKEGGEEK